MSKPFRNILKNLNSSKTQPEPTITTTTSTPTPPPTPKMSSFPPVRVITTSHTPAGRSTIHSDTLLPAHHPFGPTASGFTTIHSIPSLPASLITPPTPSAPSVPRPLPNGTVLCTTDFPPNYITPTHRTVTCDYMVVLKGELVLRVDGGEERVLKEGDVVVQRGTMHTWENRTGEWTRCLAFMAGAQKIVLADGQPLEESFTPPAKKSG
ncbi:cupin 2 domain-containing protein [Rutstroemia sp. NJR-2017a WRK4]|nr:cupin 2 domain-containing protein [Rutstroemia sp. NJR-2017a WRK4]